MLWWWGRRDLFWNSIHYSQLNPWSTGIFKQIALSLRSGARCDAWLRYDPAIVPFSANMRISFTNKRLEALTLNLVRVNQTGTRHYIYYMRYSLHIPIVSPLSNT
jgi:hypothetical protein